MIIWDLETHPVKFKMTFEVIWSRILEDHFPEIFMGVNTNKGRFGKGEPAAFQRSFGSLSKGSCRGPPGGREVPRIPALPPHPPTMFLEKPFTKETVFFFFSPFKSPRKWNLGKHSALGNRTSPSLFAADALISVQNQRLAIVRLSTSCPGGGLVSWARRPAARWGGDI